jgi:phosphonate transport system substrate-binding protein
MTGSHAASPALTEKHVDASCLSFESFMKAANRRAINARDYRIIARSDPIPNPPLALSTALPPELKARPGRR